MVWPSLPPCHPGNLTGTHEGIAQISCQSPAQNSCRTVLAPAKKGELDYLTVKGFRSIKSIEKLELRPINVLVGANGSGKSNFLEVFAFLRFLRQGHLVDYTDRAGGAEKILHFGSKATKEIEIEISFRDGTNAYHVALSPTADDRFYVHDEWCWYWVKPQYPQPHSLGLTGSGKEAGISEPQERVAGWVKRRLDSWRYYHFHDTSSTSAMRKTADVDDNRFLRADASNLAAYLYPVVSRIFCTKSIQTIT